MDLEGTRLGGLGILLKVPVTHNFTWNFRVGANWNLYIFRSYLQKERYD